jgi:HEAT repeat protein
MDEGFFEEDFFNLDPLFTSTRRLTNAEIDEIIQRFVDETLNVVEAEAAMERLARAEKRVLPRLLRLAASPDPHLHQTAIVLVREMDFTKAIEPLRKLLEDPDLEDDHKMSILHALDALGGLPPDENPFVYLRDPEAMFQRTQEATLNSFQDPLELETVLQTIMAGSVPIRDNPNILPAMADIQDRRLIPLLLCLLHASDDSVVIGAIDALTVLNDASVVPILKERALYDPVPDVRYAAQEAADELDFDAAASRPASIFDLPVAPPPLVRCLISTIDGNGGQVLVIVREQPDDQRGYLFWDVMFNDHEGIKDCFGGQSHDDEEIESVIVDGLAEIGIETLEISLKRAREELERAYQITLEANRRLPVSYMGWQSWLQDQDDTPAEVFPLPEITPEEQATFFEHCDDLTELDEFESWFFDPEELHGMERRFGQLMERRTAQEAIEKLISKAIKSVVDDQRRRLLRQRLERQAWLLAQIYEGDEIPKLALVAAAGLSDDATTGPEEHPLLREMMFNSFFNALGWGMQAPGDEDF